MQQYRIFIKRWKSHNHMSGISLLEIEGKVLARICLDRLQAHFECLNAVASGINFVQHAILVNADRRL